MFIGYAGAIIGFAYAAGMSGASFLLHLQLRA
jgi:hypothetical protein